MKKFISIFIIIFTQSIFSQETKNTSVFHRLLIYNSDNELMLVKFKGTNTWVTPGFYQDNIQFIKEGLHIIASTYGMKISNPQIKGIFSLRRENGDTKKMLIRNIYHCNYISGKIHFPKNQSFEIDEIQWLPLNEAILKIPFKSVKMFIKQTYEYPNIVWGGSLSAIKEDNKWRYQIEEEFYPLATFKK